MDRQFSEPVIAQAYLIISKTFKKRYLLIAQLPDGAGNCLERRPTPTMNKRSPPTPNSKTTYADDDD